MRKHNMWIPVLRAKEADGGGRGLRPDRDGSLTRVRRGIYVDATTLATASRDAAYLVRIQAVDAARQRAVFARESALAIHGVPFGLEPSDVFTAGGISTARRKSGVVHAPVELLETDVTTVAGMQVCSLPYALADVARRREAVAAVAAIDFALRNAAVTKAEIFDALARQDRRGRPKAEWAIEFADAAAESVGESWSRVRIFELGFAAPELQAWVEGRSGRWFRVDMRWEIPGRRPIYGEFDGMLKYGELAHQQGSDGVQALAKEKARDEDLQFTGALAHWIWDDVLRPSRLEAILSSYQVPRLRSPLRRDPRG